MLSLTRMHGVCKALEKEQRSEATQIKHKKKLYTYILKSIEQFEGKTYHCFDYVSCKKASVILAEVKPLVKRNLCLGQASVLFIGRRTKCFRECY